MPIKVDIKFDWDAAQVGEFINNGIINKAGELLRDLDDVDDILPKLRKYLEIDDEIKLTRDILKSNNKPDPNQANLNFDEMFKYYT